MARTIVPHALGVPRIPHARTPMMFQLPFPPPPDTPIGPQGPVEKFFACIVIVLLSVAIVVLLMPERWRDRISELWYGSPRAKHRPRD